VIVPPWLSTIRRVTGSPSPMPLALRVKNGSKMRFAVSVSMPSPVSVTRMSTCAPPLAAASMVNTPVPSIASYALVSRLSSTCRSCWRSARILGTSCSPISTTPTSGGGGATDSDSWTRSARSTGNADGSRSRAKSSRLSTIAAAAEISRSAVSRWREVGGWSAFGVLARIR
jgi:hypothetical protein